jgi:flagellar hook assembly protein FlgD
MSKEKRVLKEIAGLKLSKEALAAAETLLASKDGSAALADVLGAAILTTAAKFKPAAPAAAPAPTQASSKDAGKVKKDKKKDKKEKKTAKKEKKGKDKKDKKSKDKKAKGKTKDVLQSKGAALPKPDGAKPATPASTAANSSS